MRRTTLWVLVLTTFLGAGAVRAQEAAPDDGPTRPAFARDVPCQIDEPLSLWLALESVDRTILRLEGERRSMTADLTRAHKALDLLARADDPAGVPFVELTELAQAKAAGRDALDNAFAELQNDLIELDKTLVRRRGQQAALEEQLRVLSGEEPER